MVSQHTQQQTPDSERRVRSLRPFEGVVCPGIGFESGHVVWLFKFEETPTPLGGYTEVWIERPDGELTLYVDPLEAADYVTAYHEFDRVEGATVDWFTTTTDELDLSLDGADGTTLQLRVGLAQTAGTRVMELLAGGLPDALARSAVGAAVGSRMFEVFMEPNGTKLLGETETGTRYWADADRIRSVARANATIDRTDLGGQIPALSAHTHGDVSVAREPYAVFGALHLEYPAPGTPPSTPSPHQ